ncbi:hypothetical protein LY76DRAFT_588585 [Colletotrichum caudatum]|nr:hypothetical protein LY76DRAFT_588585 [Colletotrichum caudatum]
MATVQAKKGAAVVLSSLSVPNPSCAEPNPAMSPQFHPPSSGASRLTPTSPVFRCKATLVETTEDSSERQRETET